MIFSLHLKNIIYSDKLNLQMHEWAEKFFRVKNARDLKIHVYMTKITHGSDLTKKTFECHMTASAPWLNRSVFSKCEDFELWSAYMTCSRNIFQMISKDVRKNKSNNLRKIRMESREKWKENSEEF